MPSNVDWFSESHTLSKNGLNTELEPQLKVWHMTVKRLPEIIPDYQKQFRVFVLLISLFRSRKGF